MFVIVSYIAIDEEIVSIEHIYGPYVSLEKAREELCSITNIYKDFPDGMKVYIWSNMNSIHIEINHYDKIQKEMDIRTLEYYIEELSDVTTDVTPDKIVSLMKPLDRY